MRREEELHSVHTPANLRGRGLIEAPIPSTSTPTGGKQPYSHVADKIQKQKTDHHLNKRIPLRARLSKIFPLSHQLEAALCGGPRFSQ